MGHLPTWGLWLLEMCLCVLLFYAPPGLRLSSKFEEGKGAVSRFPCAGEARASSVLDALPTLQKPSGVGTERSGDACCLGAFVLQQHTAADWIVCNNLLKSPITRHWQVGRLVKA